MSPPPDLDATRRAVVARDLIATASAYLTTDVAMQLPFEALGPFKDLLKVFFSPSRWTGDDAAALDRLVGPHVGDDWFEHDLGGGISLTHGRRDGSYRLWVSGAEGEAPSIFDRVFDGPVRPEPTPHPRKVKFTTGGRPAPGVWHRRTDPEPARDPAIKRLFAEPDVTDVMVAGNFVTVGIGPGSSWEYRLEPLLALVTELYGATGAGGEEDMGSEDAERTRDELLSEAGRLSPTHRPEELHLLDPDDPADRSRLHAALAEGDTKSRRVAVAVLAEADDATVRLDAVTTGWGDTSQLVRRTAVDAAADAADEAFRPLLRDALGVTDPWVRWRATRALGELGVGEDRPLIEAALGDDDFQVRFEAAQVLSRAEHDATD